MFGGRGQRRVSLGSGVIVSRRRLRRHQQPRASASGTCAEVTVTLADKRELRAQIIGVDPRDRPRAAEDRRAEPAGDPVGRLVEAEGRRMGAGDRQPVSAQPDRHARHRQRARPRQRRHRRLRGLHPDRRRHQPGQLRRRADQQRAASWSASTPRSSARAAATRASASPCRATWRAASSTTDRYGEVRRGSIGFVELVPVDRDVARQFDLPRAEGLLVARMSRTSSAYLSGLRPGDVVLNFNGTKWTRRRSCGAWWRTRPLAPPSSSRCGVANGWWT